MIIPNVIVSWPRNCDYPLWREFIHVFRPHFNDIIVAFTETYAGEDFRNFVSDTMKPDNVICVQAPFPGEGQDWRNLAIRHALTYAFNSEWIWFTEQDFYPTNGFFEQFDEAENEQAKVIAVYEGNRMHPCSILVNRETLDKTRRFFGTKEGQFDHFGALQEDLEQLDIKIKKFKEGTYKHYAGLSHNFLLSSLGNLPSFKPEEFKDYLLRCLEVNVPMDSRFLYIARKTLDKI